jgi:hypothetical protein
MAPAKVGLAVNNVNHRQDRCKHGNTHHQRDDLADRYTDSHSHAASTWCQAEV